MPKKPRPKQSPASPQTPLPSLRKKTRSTAAMLLATPLLLALLFPPFYCFFLAPVALVPLCICILRRPMHPAYLALHYLSGILFFLPNLAWLAPVTIPGFILLALYLALYFPLFAFTLHRLVNGLRLPAILALPLLWTALEYVRSTFLEGGFPWFILGNSLAPAPMFIQIADLAGVWTVTFFIAFLNGFIVDLLRLPLKKNGKLNPLLGRMIAATAVTVFAVIAYGVFRLGQQTTTLGPTVAVIQENIPQTLKDDPAQRPINFARHLALTRQAAAMNPRPDLIAWPETMVPGPINPEVLQINEALLDPDNRKTLLAFKSYDAQLKNLSDALNVSLLVGAPGLVPATAARDGYQQNITLLYAPHEGQLPFSYAKVHLVPFGEFIPFLSLPIVGKYMINISPTGGDYSLAPGAQWTRFPLRVSDQIELVSTSAPSTTSSQPAQTQPQSIITRTHFYTFATPICFEDTMPEPARLMTKPLPGHAAKTDFLINVSNDGWFHWQPPDGPGILPAIGRAFVNGYNAVWNGVELDQRLQASQLRAVENRVPIARAVNTGNSGFVDSCGRIVILVTDPAGHSIGTIGTASHTLLLDSRITLFSRLGDLLPIASGILATLALAWTFVRPRRQQQSQS